MRLAIHFIADPSRCAYCREVQAVMKMRLLGLFAFAAIAAFSQPLSFGVKGGVPLTDLLSTSQSPASQYATSTTNLSVVGPTVELRLPRDLAVEVDALFRHFGYQWAIYHSGESSQTTATSNAWEFPLLLKYKLPGRFLRPYLDGGVAWDRLQGLSATVSSTLFDGPTITTKTSNPEELENKTS